MMTFWVRHTSIKKTFTLLLSTENKSSDLSGMPKFLRIFLFSAMALFLGWSNPAQGTDLVDSWRLLDDANAPTVLKRDPANLEVINSLGERINKTNLSDAFSNTSNPQKLIDDLGKTDNYYSGRSGIEITVDANADRIRVSRNSFDADADDITSLRTKYNAGAGKNIATGKGNIGGDDLNLETVSGQVTPQNQAQKGNFTPPDEPHYQGILGYENHTEQKIVEYLRDRYKNDFNVEGTLEIVSERPFCENCIDVVDQFQAEFPNITVIRVEVQPRY